MMVYLDTDKLADSVYAHMQTVASADGISDFTHSIYMLAAQQAKEYIRVLSILLREDIPAGTEAKE